MSTGQSLMDAGDKMSPVYSGVIKSCAVAIAPPAIVFGLSVQSIATSIYMNQCNPGDIMKAGGAWVALAEKNNEAAEALQAEIDTVDDGNWCGDDANAFKEAAGNIKSQLQELAVAAFLMGSQLIAFAVMLTVYWVFLTACTAVMVTFLTAYLAALSGVVSAPGAPAIRTSALAVATSLVASLKSFEAVLRSISTGCAALTGLITVVTFGFQKSQGNPVSPVDIAAAGLTNMLQGLAVYGLNALLMTPGGRHATTNPAIHAVQGGSALAPVYQNEDDGWKGLYEQGSGGPGLGGLDSAFNWMDEQLPDRFSNPEDVRWQ
ncbi:PPE domain-containing protein [Glycomyces tenuis]|uniref:PPE domain-containing protein n=1 Tax=Glycomyces tenuis TaxID=58116 RepID=UPI000404B016|nr:hypothetical protein [Glycomyces tenuis]